MGYRENIVSIAKWWAEPGSYKPQADDFRWICEYARLNQLPSAADYAKSATMLGEMAIGGSTRSWCGIFAVAVWGFCGVGAKWTLNWTAAKGNILTCPGLGWQKHGGNAGIRPGDIGYIDKKQHHFIVTDVNGDWICSVDGNQTNNKIVEYHWQRPLSLIKAYWSVNE